MRMNVAFCGALAVDVKDIERLVWVSGQITSVAAVRSQRFDSVPSCEGIRSQEGIHLERRLGGHRGTAPTVRNSTKP